MTPENIDVESTIASDKAATPHCPGVTQRVIVLCLCLAVLFGYIIPVIDYKLYNTFLGGTHLPPGAIGILLLLLVVVNPALHLISQKWRLSRNEILTVYLSCLFSCLLPGHGGDTLVISNLLAPFYYATPENRWLDILSGLAPWLTPSLTTNGEVNRAVIEGWYVGNGGVVPWDAWLGPLLFWIPFTLVSYCMLGCLSVMLRAQWTEHEALTYPLLRLPVELTEENRDTGKLLPTIFSNQLLWVGVGIAVFIQLFRGLHLYFPAVPEIPLSIDSVPLFTEAPWNQIGAVPIVVFPIVVGVAFLLTSEVALSLWFFFWFIKLQYVAAYLLGYPPGSLPGSPAAPGKAFAIYQISGCYLVYVGIVIWAARSHLKHVALRAFGRVPSTRGEQDEAMSYPLAFWGFVISFLFIWGATILTGVRWDLALALWVSYLVIAIGLSRLVIEAGMLLVLNQTMPLGGVARLLGDAGNTWLSPANGVVPASVFQSALVFHMRGLLMPSYLHAFKLAHDRGIHARRVGCLIAAVVVISVIVSWITTIKLGYDVGGLQLGHDFFTKHGAIKSVTFVDTFNRSEAASASSNWFWLGFGATLTYLIMLARGLFVFWPFHPLGYLACLTFSIEQFWTSIFLGWIFKVLVVRFGGGGHVRQVSPVFFGLIFGDVMMMLFWLVIDSLSGRTGHLLMPG